MNTSGRPRRAPQTVGARGPGGSRLGASSPPKARPRVDDADRVRAHSTTSHAQALAASPTQATPRRIRALDEAIDQLADERYHVARLLRQVGGVGPLVSLRFILTLEDAGRIRALVRSART